MQENYSQLTAFIVITITIIFLLAGLIVTLLYLYQKRQITFQRSLAALKLDFEKNLLQSHVEIQEQTFQNISNEIHDNINLVLSLAKLNLNTLDWLDVEGAYKSVRHSINIIGEAIEELSHLSKAINPELIQNIGLLKSLDIEIERMETMAHLQVQYEILGEPIFIEGEKELVIFRIIQEAFNNIIKHSHATKIWLQLSYSKDHLDILIKDNGVGFLKDDVLRKRKGQTAGLTNMRARAKLFGGKVMIESQEKEGTEILVSMPY